MKHRRVVGLMASALQCHARPLKWLWSLDVRTAAVMIHLWQVGNQTDQCRGGRVEMVEGEWRGGGIDDERGHQ